MKHQSTLSEYPHDYANQVNSIAATTLCAAITLKPAIANIGKPRAFTFDEFLFETANATGSDLLQQGITATAAIAAAVVVFTARSPKPYSERETVDSLLIASILFFTLTSLRESLNGLLPNLTTILPLIVIGAIWKSDERPLRLIIQTFYLTSGLVLFSSLIAAVAAPSWAFVLDYQAESALFSIRFAGLLAHPNAIGALSAATVLSAHLFSRSFLSLIVIISALASLAMSQSKTSVIAMVVGLFTYKLFMRRSRISCGIVMTVTYIAFMLGWFIYMNMQPYLPSNEFTSITGRTDIWDVALEIWSSNHLLGAGLRPFSPELMAAEGLTGAVNAHNQFLITATTVGWVGVSALSVFVALLVLEPLRSRYCSTPPVLVATYSGITVFILVRGTTESVFALTGVDLILILIALSTIRLGKLWGQKT